MKSADKFAVTVGPLAGLDKEWVTVTFADGTRWVPSFEDLFRVLVAIGECEDAKYPNGKGRWMIADFVAACLVKGTTWDAVRDRFKIPRRD